MTPEEYRYINGSGTIGRYDTLPKEIRVMFQNAKVNLCPECLFQHVNRSVDPDPQSHKVGGRYSLC